MNFTTSHNDFVSNWSLILQLSANVNSIKELTQLTMRLLTFHLLTIQWILSQSKSRSLPPHRDYLSKRTLHWPNVLLRVGAFWGLYAVKSHHFDRLFWVLRKVIRKYEWRDFLFIFWMLTLSCCIGHTAIINGLQDPWKQHPQWPPKFPLRKGMRLGACQLMVASATSANTKGLEGLSSWTNYQRKIFSRIYHVLFLWVVSLKLLILTFQPLRAHHCSVWGCFGFWASSFLFGGGGL